MAEQLGTEGVYGSPLRELADVAPGARRFSPLTPGAEALEDLADASLTRIVVAAPPGAVEHRYVLAQALRVLAPGGELIALAPKDKSGSRLRKTLESLGCSVEETARRHHRICQVRRPQACDGLAEAIAEGGPRIAPNLGLWSQPGVFSWDRLDPGSAQLLATLPDFVGRGADLGCGVGVLARAVLKSPNVTSLALVDIDRRAIAAARRNIDDPRASFAQADLREPAPLLTDLNFVIMNPPFHDAGAEDRRLGQTFIRRAAAMLKKGGTCRLVANIGMPYEAILAECFKTVTPLGQRQGYKLFEARK
ncbi:MAG: methyltransferase [Caulobacteraceae bacterium]|nr:methyltransferase [Caulobacteraceae bacterium]